MNTSEQHIPAFSLWNGLTMRPDGGWMGNMCQVHLDKYHAPISAEGFEIRQEVVGNAPCYVCERIRLDAWQGSPNTRGLRPPEGDTMACKGTDINVLAQEIVSRLQAIPEDTGSMYIFLQPYEMQAGGGHLHYTVHCDRPCWGSQEAEEAVRAILPDGVYHLLYDEGAYNTVHDAWEDALIQAYE